MLKKLTYIAATFVFVVGTTPAFAQSQASLMVKDGQGANRNLCEVNSPDGSVLVPCSNLYIGGAPVTQANPVPTLPIASAAVPYVSGTVLDYRNYGSVVLGCSTAPTAVSFNISFDTSNLANVGTTNALVNPISQTAVQNNSTSITTVSSGSSSATWTIQGRGFVSFNTGSATCFVLGSQ